MKMKIILLIFILSLIYSKQQILRKTQQNQIQQKKSNNKQLLRQKKINQQPIVALADKKLKSYQPQSVQKNNRFKEQTCKVFYSKSQSYITKMVEPKENYYLQKLNLEYKYKTYKFYTTRWWWFWDKTHKENAFVLKKMIATYFNVYEDKGQEILTVFEDGTHDHKSELGCATNSYINEIDLGIGTTTKDSKKITQYVRIKCIDIFKVNNYKTKNDEDTNTAKEQITYVRKFCSQTKDRMFITDLTVQYHDTDGLRGIKYKLVDMECPKTKRLNNQICVSDIENCKIYANNTCSNCLKGYQLDNLLCYKEIANCKSQSKNICNTCDDGYTKDSQKCAKTVENCELYADLKCSICKDNYELLEQTCVKIIDNCTEMKINETCKTCDTDYVLASDGATCYETLKGCTSQVDDKCNKCTSAYFLYNDVCSDLIVNCKEQKTDVLCKTCNDGYFESDGNCYKLIDKCQKYDKAECSECDEGYYTLQTSCNELSEGCATQNADGCLTCNVKYELKEDKCLYFIQNCDKFNDDKSACEICETKYSLQNGLCLKEIDDCAIQIIDTCSECNQGFELAKNNRVCQKTKKSHKKSKANRKI